MFTVLFAIIKVLFGMGLAGILIVIGMVAVVTWLIKSIIVRIYWAIHHPKLKGGDGK